MCNLMFFYDIIYKLKTDMFTSSRKTSVTRNRATKTTKKRTAKRTDKQTGKKTTKKQTTNRNTDRSSSSSNIKAEVDGTKLAKKLRIYEYDTIIYRYSASAMMGIECNDIKNVKPHITTMYKFLSKLAKKHIPDNHKPKEVAKLVNGINDFYTVVESYVFKKKVPVGVVRKYSKISIGGGSNDNDSNDSDNSNNDDDGAKLSLCTQINKYLSILGTAIMAGLYNFAEEYANPKYHVNYIIHNAKEYTRLTDVYIRRMAKSVNRAAKDFKDIYNEDTTCLAELLTNEEFAEVLDKMQDVPVKMKKIMFHVGSNPSNIVRLANHPVLSMMSRNTQMFNGEISKIELGLIYKKFNTLMNSKTSIKHITKDVSGDKASSSEKQRYIDTIGNLMKDAYTTVSSTLQSIGGITKPYNAKHYACNIASRQNALKSSLLVANNHLDLLNTHITNEGPRQLEIYDSSMTKIAIISVAWAVSTLYTLYNNISKRFRTKRKTRKK